MSVLRIRATPYESSRLTLAAGSRASNRATWSVAPALRRATSNGFSLCIPIRDYVQDDLEACERVLAVMSRCGLDTAPFVMALAKIVQRPLRESVGVIAYVSLRLGGPRPAEVTVYLSSEAYDEAPPRTTALSSDTTRPS